MNKEQNIHFSVSRGIHSGLVAVAFNSNFKTGFLYGIISSIFHSISYPFFKNVTLNRNESVMKSFFYWTSQFLPWCFSFGVMHLLNKVEGTTESLYLLPCSTGVCIALEHSILGVEDE